MSFLLVQGNGLQTSKIQPVDFRQALLVAGVAVAIEYVDPESPLGYLAASVIGAAAGSIAHNLGLKAYYTVSNLAPHISKLAYKTSQKAYRKVYNYLYPQNPHIARRAPAEIDSCILRHLEISDLISLAKTSQTFPLSSHARRILRGENGSHLDQELALRMCRHDYPPEIIQAVGSAKKLYQLPRIPEFKLTGYPTKALKNLTIIRGKDENGKPFILLKSSHEEIVFKPTYGASRIESINLNDWWTIRYDYNFNFHMKPLSPEMLEVLKRAALLRPIEVLSTLAE